MTDAEKRFVRFWGVYWILVLVLVFVLVGLALVMRGPRGDTG